MIIGASTNREKFGNKSIRAHLRKGHEVFPVNPRATEIEGVRCYPTAGAPPGPIDRVSMYLPPALGIRVLPELAERGDVAELWLNPGAESPELVREARRLGFEPILACSIIDIGERP
jgi:predicted CoA-binding protein